MIKCIHLCEQLNIGGISSFIKDLLSTMQTHNFDFRIVYFYGKGDLEEEFKNSGIQVAGVGMQKKLRIDPYGLIKLWRQIRLFNPDIIHCHGPYTLLASLLLRSFMGNVPVIFTFHGTFRSGDQKSDFIMRKAFKRSNQLITVSRKSANAMSCFLKNNVPISVIQNGIDITRLKAPKSFSKLKKRLSLNFSTDDLIILSVFQFNRTKDHESLLLAFNRIREKVPKARLFLAGDGPLKMDIKNIISQLQLNESVKLGGLRTDITELLNISDLFVLSSRTEGLPITLLEAAGIGLPCIASAVGGVPEVLEAGVPCILVPPIDPQALYDAILFLLQNGDIRKKMGEQAKKSISLYFHINQTARKYAELYELTIHDFKKF